MRKFSIKILNSLIIGYNNYLSTEFIEGRGIYFKKMYPLRYWSRKFDKPAKKYKNGTCGWVLDNEWHRVGKPAYIYSDRRVYYWENGKRVRGIILKGNIH